VTHLGADVAAYVDGQLSDHAMRAADAHLLTCDECERAVRQQRLVKSRMSTVAAPEPPSDLIDTLSRLQAVPPEPASWWDRLCRATPATVGLAVLGASMAVLAAAYVIGGSERFDPVRPGFEDYAAEFLGATATSLAATYTMVEPERLDAQGWPCHEVLAGDLHRTSTAYDRTSDIVSVTYTDGMSRLSLYEQPGRLDPASLADFEEQHLANTRVWVREGVPKVVTWDQGGIVFTIVSDADTARIARAVADLPAGSGDSSPLERIGGGLDRMTSWAAA